MADHGIIFSASMVLALLAGRKTQTRRLATSPLRRVVPGDRLWVRETHAVVGEGAYLLFRAPGFEAECDRHGFDKPYPPESSVRWTPSIHMRRTASRLTLQVTEVRVEPLQNITESDALAEGLVAQPMEGPGGLTVDTFHWLPGQPDEETYITPVYAYRALWESLHRKEGHRWIDNPDLLALTFTVEQRNIDR